MARAMNEVSTRVQGDPVLIGTITDTDLNSAGATETVNIVYTGAKLAGKYVDRLFCKNTESFVSYGYTSTITIDKIELIDSSPSLGVTTLGQFYPASVSDDVTIKITLSAANPQDWTAGNINVYVTYVDYPSI